MKATSPFVFSTVSESSILRLLKLVDCDNGEIGLFETGGRLYAVQSGQKLAAFVITDVTDNAFRIDDQKRIA